jgi:transcription initiation factor TFIIB
MTTELIQKIDPKNIWTDPETGEVVDRSTGEVIGYELDRGPEWRAFDEEQRAKRVRVGAPLTPTLHDKGLSTFIDRKDRNIHRGKELEPGQNTQINRLRKWQKKLRTQDASERNLAYALYEISKISNKLSLPKNVLETASFDYRKACKERLIRGRSIQGMTAGVIYLACRKCGLARGLTEIAAAADTNKKEVARNYRFLVKELEQEHGHYIPPFKAGQYVTKLSNQLTMQGKVEEIAHKIIKAARDSKLTSGRGPAGIAAASSYIASVLTGEKKTQREIAEIAQVTEVTIRNRYKELVDRLQIEIFL